MRPKPNTRLPLTAAALRLYMRSGLRGQYRLTNFLAPRLSSLQSIPIKVAGNTLFIDLRSGTSFDLLKGSPWPAAPYETDEQNVMRRFVRKGDVAFDIGANIGLHTLLLSELVGTAGNVFAFEPNPDLTETLTATVNALPNAKLLNVALSDQRSESTLFIPNDHTMASLADWTRDRLEGEVHQAVCQQITIDEVVNSGVVKRPDFIKCDVEGAELKVFTGARQTLDRADAPIMLFEINVHTAQGFGVDPLAALNFLAELPNAKYRFFQLQNDGRLLESRDVHLAHSNVLAVPGGRVESDGVADRV